MRLECSATCPDCGETVVYAATLTRGLDETGMRALGEIAVAAHRMAIHGATTPPEATEMESPDHIPHPESETAPTWCPACEGRGTVPCIACEASDDDLRTECLRCYGSHREECPDCSGSGRRSTLPPLKTDTLAGMTAQYVSTCASQRYAAMHYARAIRENAPGTANEFEPEHWRTINEAIRRRWPKGLERVKRLAWKMVEDPSLEPRV